MDFAFNLYQKLSEKSIGNIFMSPFSISSILAMTLLGARQNTAEQLIRCLQYDKDMDVHKENLKIMKSLQLSRNVTFKIASKLFAEKSFVVVAQFKKDCKKYYQVSVESLDFTNKSDKSIDIINVWAEKETKGKINDLLPSGSINEDTKLVLANAIYFKGNWMNKFNNIRTSRFFVNENRTEKVEIMTHTRKYNFYFDNDLEVDLVEVPYKNEDFSLILIVPFKKFGLCAVEKTLTASKFQALLHSMKINNIALGLPKMKIEYDFNLISALKQMGVHDVFNPLQANLEGISHYTSENLFVSGVYHKAVLEASEEELEAVAPKAVTTEECGVDTRPKEVICDRPFMFAIRHIPTSSVLFLGRFVIP